MYPLESPYAQLLWHLYMTEIRTELRKDAPAFGKTLLVDSLRALKTHCDPVESDGSNEQSAIGPMRLIVIIVAILCRHSMMVLPYEPTEMPNPSNFYLDIDNHGVRLRKYTLTYLVAQGNACAASLTGPEAAEYHLDWAFFSAWISLSLGDIFESKKPTKLSITSDASSGTVSFEPGKGLRMRTIR
jgi:hypothetical protein